MKYCKPLRLMPVKRLTAVGPRDLMKALIRSSSVFAILLPYQSVNYGATAIARKDLHT